MNLIPSIHPISGASLLARTTLRVRARAIDSTFDPDASIGDPVLDSYHVLPGARTAITGTNAPSPLWLSKCCRAARVYQTAEKVSR